MPPPTDRRQFLGAAALGSLGLVGRLPLVSAEEARLDGRVAQLDSEIEPLVRLLEETPRERLLEEIGGRIRKGLSYREVLAALFLAGVRNVEPRPSVGFKFHAVLVVNAAHLASLAGPDDERWLPIFWALDYFKVAQAQNAKERNGWRMPPVKESTLPPARNAKKALVEALEKWDAEAADVAVASLVRSAGADDVAEVFWKYAPRDFRAIGHKIIFASNTRRLLGTIGWQHAEPVYRSLTYALMSSGNVNPATADDPADRPGRTNRELAKRVPEGWLGGKVDAGATAELLTTFRQASAEGAGDAVVAHLLKGLSPQSIWDAILTGAGELLMRRPGIVSLHSITTTNAMRFAFDTSADDATRRWLLLQAASFLTMFRGELAARKENLSEQKLDQLEPLSPNGTGAQAVEEIFADVSKDKEAAARKVLGYLKTTGDARPITDAARRLVFHKGTDSHDYKFSSAALEDYAHVSPAWRGRYLAASVFWLKGSGDKEADLVRRTKDAIG
jgi:hypothetical protein